ncbi:MAG: nucleoside deaminase [Candidatus Thermoplasmatota archaeon]|nr:nucleoside deaminase [Euryarchaeota archaeon]MBU4031962.1 nucleoside deaminase [Candidatus Thermoplasmatota archaeon]MBU4071195.1 nucleoside deaminase [Candidatus Thermoplasmatota archaeon]MBU4143606.1 nucleoside deaminase [Candidatus Thermoplasmatota archaeon]MBU4591341.1 nucleoside deaminase [Candidatus Thermoplasmatota archaeon]
MHAAIDKAREGMGTGQTPFGACIVRNGEIIACEHNRVWGETDITAHAEIVAIREACRKLGTIDLSGCTIYTTTEPCTMCFSAIHWARIGRIIFGASIGDAADAGFNELTISNEKMKEMGESLVDITGGFMRQECVELFTEFVSRPEKKTY